METLKNRWDEMSNEMSIELLLLTSCGDDGLKLVIKICYKNTVDLVIFAC